ncbi:MAG TPA: mechanosensitive ion channel domain-containing protein [Bryobacteraceae bacterium]|nr:mechanosensitive ion channel domain-containing protein [Bryobacteraceae bacterium]
MDNGMNDMHQVLTDPFVLAIPLALLIGTIVLGLVARRVVFKVIQGWAKRTDSQLDVLLIDTLRGPMALWIVILGLHVATQHSEIPQPWKNYFPPTLQVLWGLSFTIAISQFAGSMVRFYGGTMRGVQSVSSLSQKLVQFSILVIGCLWLAKVIFNFSLAPLLTTLGVGGIAVALALQDTLSNLFAGFYVAVSGLVRIGDYIQLNTKEEGYIADINWRCTTMRTGANNLIVIPNNKLGQAIFTNYFLPDGRVGISLLCGVSQDTDIDLAEKLLLDEILQCASSVSNVMADPPPAVRFNPGPWGASLVFQVAFSVTQFANVPLARSEVRKRLYKRLRGAGISVTFPATSTPE